MWAVIPAAGSGSRFSKTELKQYQYIQNTTVLEHTVRRISQLPLNGYVLAIGTQDTFAQTLAFQDIDKAHFCMGGVERVHSVLNALNHLLTFADENDWVLVHDAARPCVTIECLNALVEQAIESNHSAILAIPVRDTLKLVKSGNQIDKTVSRDLLWQAQTPQIAKIGKLKKAIEYALENNIAITDEASALEYMGETVQVVMGRSDNIKITYPDDLELARLILQSQS
ncbi:2-C-methyl-D-erythritol 4-phosphate cytidylyltransferase [Acinetobacter pittii]|nr:2-C-methyl-D-erythritol 4-phosphate cytidylyltransferase [Acinetobacter pittii]